ncbi:MAG: hypothetical protein DRI61_10430, partial [Chloroflexi bacterium]
MGKKWSLAIALVVTLGMLLSACATPTPKVVEKVVTKEVTKEVVVTKEVTKEVVVTPTPVPGVEKVTLNIN